MTHTGKCKNEVTKPTCVNNCSGTLKIVCGSDGETYPNECLLNLVACREESNLKIKHLGACTPATCKDIYCSQDYLKNCDSKNPVCGNDGMTYPTECDLMCAACGVLHLEVAYPGECQIPTTTTTMSSTIITTTTTTNLNSNCENTCNCDDNQCSYICGSNNVTYCNECQMKCQACKTNSEIFILYPRPCVALPINPDCDEICNCDLMETNVVCGTDGISYPNTCTLECNACKENSGVIIDHPGDCEKTTTTTESTDLCSEKCNCEDIEEPVCGSDGMTYPNECKLNCKACMENSDLVWIFDGECPLKKKLPFCPCPKDYQPICGNDGKTYGNICAYGCAQQYKHDLEMAYYGKCKKNDKMINMYQYLESISKNQISS